MGYYQQLDAPKRRLVDKHLELVIEANKTTNLTRIDSIDEAMTLHV